MPCLANNIRSPGFGFSFHLRFRFLFRPSIRTRRTLTTASEDRLRKVPLLASWDSRVFEHAYQQALPVRLPRSRAHLPPACWKWFIHEDDADFELFHIGQRDQDGHEVNVPSSSELRASFWADYDSTFVPLELTTKRDGE